MYFDKGTCVYICAFRPICCPHFRPVSKEKQHGLPFHSSVSEKKKEITKGFSLVAEPLKSLGKKGKMLPKARISLKNKGNSIKKGKEDKGKTACIDLSQMFLKKTFRPSKLLIIWCVLQLEEHWQGQF